jgi:hypothetical protein
MNMEEQLWEYMDGFGTEEEQKAIRLLIENDETYQKKYAELKAFQDNIAELDLEEPAMGFTFKVMENIQSEQILKPLKTTVNQYIVRGIAAFFICGIVLLLGYVFANINWSAQAPVKLPEIKLPAASFYLNPAVIKGFLFLDLILGLFFADHYFRKLFFEKK